MIEIIEKAGKVIIEMQHENTQLEQKFGTASRIVINRKRQTEVLAKFYDEAVEALNEDQKALFIQSINHRAMKILFEQEAGQSYCEMAAENAFDKKDWKMLDRIDNQIEEIRSELE